MTNQDWFAFFSTCAEILGAGEQRIEHSSSWCAWTTFGSLSSSVHYWSAGLPKIEDLDQDGILDNSVWSQPFLYEDLAHIIIPREFYWQVVKPGYFENGTRQKNIDAVSSRLEAIGIPHRKTDLVLEIKIY